MIFDGVLDAVAVRRDRRKVHAEQLQAAEEFVWKWAETVDPESHAFGADLDCAETNTLANLFRVFHFWNTADQLVREHGPNCNNAEPHQLGDQG